MPTASALAFHKVGSQAMVARMRPASPQCFQTASAKGIPKVTKSAKIHKSRLERASPAWRAMASTVTKATRPTTSDKIPNNTQAKETRTELKKLGSAGATDGLRRPDSSSGGRRRGGCGVTARV